MLSELTLRCRVEVFLKIHILSDLHVEFGNFAPPVVGADVVVLAGDVHVKDRGLQWIFDQKLEHQPRLWIHGHTHESFDYQIGKTRVVCNPRGYASIEENHCFRPDYTVVV